MRSTGWWRTPSCLAGTPSLRCGSIPPRSASNSLKSSPTAPRLSPGRRDRDLAGGWLSGTERDRRQPRAVARDADRDRLLGLLREHYALSHIDDAELDRRTGIVLNAAYTDEAATAVSGLPLLGVEAAGPAAGQGAPPGRGKSPRRDAPTDRPCAGR